MSADSRFRLLFDVSKTPGNVSSGQSSDAKFSSIDFTLYPDYVKLAEAIRKLSVEAGGHKSLVGDGVSFGNFIHVPRLSLENLPGELWSESQLLEHNGCIKFAATQLGATRLRTSVAPFPKSLVAELAKGEARLRDEASFGEDSNAFFETSRLSTPAARTVFDDIADGDGDWVTDGATTQDPFELPASGNPFDVPEWADRPRKAAPAAEATAKQLLDQAQIQSVQANMSALVTSYQAEFPKTAALVRRGKGEFATLDSVHPTFLVIVAKHFALCDKLSVLMRKSAEEWKLSGAGPLASRFHNLCDPEMASLLDSTFASLVERGAVTMSLTPLESIFGISTASSCSSACVKSAS